MPKLFLDSKIQSKKASNVFGDKLIYLFKEICWKKDNLTLMSSYKLDLILCKNNIQWIF